MTRTRKTVLPYESDHGRWVLVRREPPVELLPYAVSYTGYLEQERHFARHLEPASTRIPLIISLGSPFRISSHRGHETEIGSFAAGLFDGPVLVGSDGPQYTLQVGLTPLGARRIFEAPMDQLTNRIVGLDDLLGDRIPLLAEQLAEAPTWDERFTLLDTFLIDRIDRSAEPPPAVAFAWEQIERSGGQASIGELAREIGWSHRRLIAQFREHIGLPPKKLARLLRFERAIRSLHDHDSVCLASLAQSTGYFDQAHLYRDFREFAGRTPADLLRRRLPGMEGLIGD